MEGIYTGCTWNIANRLEQHIAGKGSKYTAKYGVKQLVYYEEHESIEVARTREIQLKNWSQVKKRKLIEKWNKDE